MRFTFKSQSQTNIWDLDIKAYFFCRNNCWLMKNMDKGLIVPKWVLIVQPKIPQMPQNLSAKFVCPSPKILDFNEKWLHWASIVRDSVRSGQFVTQDLRFFLCESAHCAKLRQAPLTRWAIFKFLFTKSLYCFEIGYIIINFWYTGFIKFKHLKDNWK